MTARMIQRSLHTAGSCLLARVPRRANPGLGYQLQQLQEHPARPSEASEDYADLESDFMGVQKTHRQYEKEQQQQRDRIRQFMIKHKYFRDAKLPNLLLHAEKEQMRLLHERDPEEWSVERLAESFPATPEIVQKVLRAKWRPRSVQRIRSHDETVIQNWQLLRSGKGDFNLPPALLQHLQKFAERRRQDLRELKTQEWPTKPQLPIPQGRLIAMGTMEQKVYERQVAKQATAKRVIDEQQISRHYNQTDLMELYSYELQPTTEREMPILPKDRLFAEILTEHDKLIFKYHEHDSLLEQEEHENLSEEERKSAWAEYEAEKTRTVQASQYMSYDRNAFGNQVMGQFGNASGSVTSNKIFGFRSDILLQLLNMKISKDHPELNQNQVIQLVPTYLQQLYNEMNNGDPTMYKDLLSLHSNIVHPSGMYMNPLLYANQHPNAAGYNQGTGGPPGPAGSMPPGPHAAPAPGFEPDKVYEID